MKPAALKKLASDLQAHGVQSEYLDRVQARVTPEDQLEKLQRELVQEMASALGRSEDRINVALAELQLQRARYGRAVADGASDAELADLIAAYEAQRQLAQKRLRELQIHREAVGFRRNNTLQELYPIPGRIRR